LDIPQCVTKCNKDSDCDTNALERCEQGNSTCVPVFCDPKSVQFGNIEASVQDDQSSTLTCNSGFVVKKPDGDVSKAAVVVCKFNETESKVHWMLKDDLKFRAKCIEGCASDNDCSSPGEECSVNDNKCVKKPCPPLELDNGQKEVNIDHFVFGDLVSVVCDPGFIQNHSSKSQTFKEAVVECRLNDDDETAWFVDVNDEFQPYKGCKKGTSILCR